jgi:thymidylate kinase
MVVILVEGLQGVGKTSLFARLEELKVVTSSKLPRTASASTTDYTFVNKLNTESAKSVIIELAKSEKIYFVDRYIASEFVFGKICKRKDDYEWLWAIDKELSAQFNKLKHTVFTAYITAPWQFCVDNIWKRRSTYTAELMIAKLPEASALYEKYLENSLIPIIAYRNNPIRSIDENAKQLWDAIKSITKVEAEIKGD